MSSGSSICRCCDACTYCPEGPYPDIATVSVPSLGISGPAMNTNFETPYGDFEYLWEGSNNEYYWQCTFTRCGWSVRIHRIENPPPDVLICLGSEVEQPSNIRAMSCPPEPLIISYQVRCSDGSSLTLVLSE